MLSTALLTLVPALAPTAPGAIARGVDAKVTPPGLVLIPGGRTRIGAEPRNIETLIAEEPEASERARGLWGETPQHNAEVPDFFLMVTEVTNEQYAVFVRATGHRPPMSWGQKAVEAATYEFGREQGRLRDEAKQKGEPLPPAKTFDATKWWEENWRSVQARMPAGRELHPVTMVSFHDAEAYARWAGLRLPTEQEYQRAVRGNGTADFPWGASFDPARAGTTEAGRRTDSYPVGSFPSGANGQQVLDLAGNVWEWTSSPYLPYPGYKPTRLTVGTGKQRREISVDTAFEAGKRVLVSGSYNNSSLAARASVRRGTERFQTLELLGFRCAASSIPGQDVATALLDQELPSHVRPSIAGQKVGYKPAFTIGLERWLLAEGGGAPTDATSGIAAPAIAARESAGPAVGGPPPGYAVIGGYEYAIFTPIDKLPAANQPTLIKDTVEKSPVPLGMLATSMKLAEPALEPGVYMLSFRGAGEKKPERKKPDSKPTEGEGEGAEDVAPIEIDLVKEIGLDPTVDNFVLYDKAGAPLMALPVRSWGFERLEPGKSRIVQIEHTEGSGKEAVVERRKWLELDIAVESLLSSKGFRFKLPLRFEDPAVLEREWRMR